MKKGIWLVLFTIVLSGCNSSSWELEKERAGEIKEVQAYVESLQEKTPDAKGYRVFTISEGKKMIVLSSGDENNALRLEGVSFSSEKTTITVKETNKNNGESNPYLMIGLREIKGDLVVQSTDGKIYKKQDQH